MPLRSVAVATGSGYGVPMDEESRELQVTALDWIGVMVVACAVLALFAMPFLTPQFGQMFAEFDNPLPVLTRMVLAPWFPPALSVLPLGCLWVAFRAPSMSRRYVSLMGAFVLGYVSILVCIVGLYLPVFTFSVSGGPQ